MSVTQLTTRQIGSSGVNRDDLDTTTTGKAVVTKIIAGTNITLGSTGVDTGTGDVTVNSPGPDIQQSVMTLSTNFTVTAGYSAQSVRLFKISSGIKLTIGSGGIFKIN